MYCPNCEQIFLIYVVKHDTSDRPVEEQLVGNYCPQCGYEFPKIKVEKDNKNGY